MKVRLPTIRCSTSAMSASEFAEASRLSRKSGSSANIARSSGSKVRLSVWLVVFSR
jgi:hypothetical protein